MSDQSRAEHRERVVRTVEYNTDGSAPDALDADHIRVHLCANGGYPVEAINRAIADALEAGELDEVEGGSIVVDDSGRCSFRFTDALRPLKLVKTCLNWIGDRVLWKEGSG